jgi:benzoyl-CoA reductase subunit C
MILGSPNYDFELAKLIESTGGVVVADMNCTGSSYFEGKTEPQEDRVQALAERYCSRLPCPQRDFGIPESPKRRRPAFALKLAREYNVQGVIFIQQKFCDPHAYDAPTIISLLKENGFDTLLLEVDVTTPVGQLRTRLEAFLEVLQLDLV